jgi:hypothetical protein
MGEFPRKADGRWIFTEFKRGIVQQIGQGREDAGRGEPRVRHPAGVIREWTHRVEAGAKAAVAANEDAVPASALREAHRVWAMVNR